MAKRYHMRPPAGAFDEKFGYRRGVMRALWICLSAWLALACNQVSHEQLDNWKNTEKGPAKLADVVLAAAEPVDMRAHAGENLLVIGEAAKLWQALGTLTAADRLAVVAPLSERVWQRARVQSADDIPTASQVAAKDWLVRLRAFGSLQTAAAIDQYLLDWYAQPSLDARATLGDHGAIEVMNALGEAAGPRMRATLDELLARPMPKNTYVRIGDEMMAALAATHEPEALRHLWKTAMAQRRDPTLVRRAIMSLYRAFGHTIAGGTPNEAIAVLRHELTSVARGDIVGAEGVRSQALELLGALPVDMCGAVMSELIAPLRQTEFAWPVAGYLTRCAYVMGGNKYDAVISAAGVAVANTPPPGPRASFAWVPPVAAIAPLAAHRDVWIRWLAIELAGICTQRQDGPDAASCMQLLRDRRADAATVKVASRTVALNKRAAELIAAAEH